LGRVLKADLDWIVMKALEKSRGRRYETANGLAMDLQRYLCDEPVLACPPSAWYRLRKFARRNMTILLSASVVVFVLFTAVAALSASTVLIWHEKNKTQTANLQLKAEQARSRGETERAEKALATAEANYKHAREIVESMLTRVGVELSEQPHMESLCSDILEQALNHYRDFLKHRSDDPDLRLQTALAWYRVGDIQQMLGKYETAAEALEQSNSLWDKLVIERPDAHTRRMAWQSILKLAYVHVRCGRFADAEQAYQRVLASREEPGNDRDASAPDLVELASTFHSLARVLEAQAKWSEARQLLENSVAHFQAAIDLEPRRLSYQSMLGTALCDLANTLDHLNEHERAEQECQKAMRIQQIMVFASPTRPVYRRRLAATSNVLGSLLVTEKKDVAADQTYRKAIKEYDRLISEYPSTPQYRDDLAEAC